MKDDAVIKDNEAVYLLNEQTYLHLRENLAGVGYEVFDKNSPLPVEEGQIPREVLGNTQRRIETARAYYLAEHQDEPVGRIINMDGRKFRIDGVDFDKGKVSLQDMALADLRMPIFREEPLALVRELYEEQDMMEYSLPDYKVGDNVVVELPTRTIEGKVGYVGETDVRIDTSAHGQSWDNEVINKQQFEEGLRQNEPNSTRPVRTEKTVAVYPAKENNLPFDIVIQTISTESPTVEAERPTLELAGNFRITDDHLGEGGAKQKYARNIEAIRTLFKLEEEHRGATAEEQQVLSQYVGWGGLADAFDPGKDSWAKEYAELKGLLSEDEYAAFNGIVHLFRLCMFMRLTGILWSVKNTIG